MKALDGDVRSERHPRSSAGPPNRISSPPCDYNLGALRKEAWGGEMKAHGLKGIKDGEEGGRERERQTGRKWRRKGRKCGADQSA